MANACVPRAIGHTPLPDRDRARFRFSLSLRPRFDASPEKLLLLRGRVVLTACTAKQVRRAVVPAATAAGAAAASSSRSSAGPAGAQASAAPDDAAATSLKEAAQASSDAHWSQGPMLKPASALTRPPPRRDRRQTQPCASTH